MENKLHFWIISDEPPTKDGIKLYLQKARYDEKIVKHVHNHLKWEIVGEHLCNCKEKLSGAPDIIIMDMSSLTLGNNFNTYGVLRNFLKKHSASRFHLVCYVYFKAEEVIEEIKEIFKEEDILLTAGENGNEAIANYMFDKVLEYYPYE